jgi:hypothetical protein
VEQERFIQILLHYSAVTAIWQCRIYLVMHWCDMSTLSPNSGVWHNLLCLSQSVQTCSQLVFFGPVRSMQLSNDHGSQIEHLSLFHWLTCLYPPLAHMHNSIHSSNQSFVSLGKVIFSTLDPHCMIIEFPLTSSPYYAFATSSVPSLLPMQLCAILGSQNDEYE